MRPLPKPIRWIVRVLVAVYLLYLVVGNACLNTPLGPKAINQRPEGFRMHWSWGVTAWPGWIYLCSPSLQGRARWQQWSLSGDEAYGRIALLPLLRRQLRFVDIHAAGVHASVVRAASDRLPPPWSASAWTVVLRGIHTDSLQQVRWHGLSFEGRATADVGFSHQLRGGATEVFASHVQVASGQVTLNGAPVLKAMTLDLRGAIAPFRHAQPPGAHKLALLQAKLVLDATTPALAPTAPGGLRHWLGGGKASALPDGQLHADIALDHARVQDGGELRWDVPLAITAPDGMHAVPAYVQLQARHDGLRLQAKVASLPGDTTRHAELALHYADRRVFDVPPRELLQRIDGTLKLNWHFASLDWLGPLLAKDWLTLEGDGHIDADLRLAHGVLQPGSHAGLPAVNLRARVFDNVFAGQAQATVTVSDDGEDPVSLAIRADRYTLAAADHPEAVYLHGNDLAINLHSTADVAHFARQAHGRLHFRDARIPDLRAYNRYLPGGSVHILGGHGSSSADLTLGRAGAVTAGTLHLDGTGLDLALGVARLRADLDVDAKLTHARKTAPRHYALSSFGVALRHVRMDDDDDAGWWAKAKLTHGELDWREPFQLRGDVQLAMKDASVLLSLFAKKHAFPAWIAHIVDDGRMEAAGQLAVGKRKDGRPQFVLDDVKAHNQRVDLKARLRILDGKPDGALYAKWGVLGLGVALKGGQRDFHLVGASTWYDAQPPLLGGHAPPTTLSP